MDILPRTLEQAGTPGFAILITKELHVYDADLLHHLDSVTTKNQTQRIIITFLSENDYNGLAELTCVNKLVTEGTVLLMLRNT